MEEKQSTELVETPKQVGPLVSTTDTPNAKETAQYVAPTDDDGGVTSTYPRIRIVHAEQKFTFPGDVTRIRFEAAIVHRQVVKAYWPADVELNSPPRCASRDGKVPDPFIEEPMCEACSVPMCPKNVRGSDEKGNKGKACKDMERLWLYFHPDEYPIPLQLSTPPTSCKVVDDYIGDCKAAGKHQCFFITEFSLDAQERGAQRWSRLRLRTVGLLSKEHIEPVVFWHGRIIEAATAEAVTPADYGTDRDTQPPSRQVSAEEAAKYGGGGVDEDDIPF